MNNDVVMKYPEGLQLLASQMDLPMESTEEREGYVMAVVGFAASL